MNDPVIGLMPTIGASGAISGILAAYMRLFPRTRLYQIFFFQTFKVPVFFYVFLWILSNIGVALSPSESTQIAWAAHLGGFTAGYFLIPYFIPFDIEEIRERRSLLG